MFKSLRSKLLFYVLGTIIFTLFIMIFLVQIATQRTILKSQNEYAHNLVNSIFLSVQNQYQSILFQKDISKKQRQKELKNISNIVFNLIDSYYKKYSDGVLSETEAKTEALKNIEKIRYDNGVGYFWINDTGKPFPEMIMHPVMPELNNTILSNEVFNTFSVSGKNLFQEIVDICLSSGEGFVEYLWPKPLGEELSSDQPKISHVKLYKKWNWIIGTGVYIDDIEKDVELRINAVLEELKETFSKVQIADNGYIYVFTGDNTMLIHPTLEGQDVRKMINPATGKNIFDDLIKASETSDIPFYYLWDKPGFENDFRFRKQAYIIYFKPLDWYIASSIYMDEIEKPVKKLSKHIIFLSVFFIGVITALLLLLSQNLTKPLHKLMIAAQNIEKNGIENSDIPVSGTLETRELGSILESMINSIQKSDEQLRQAQKMETVGTLAGGIAHDFNNMLGGIIGTLSLIEYNLSDNGKIETDQLTEYISTMNECSSRASNMVNQLLALSRKQEIIFSRIDLNEIVNNVIQIGKNSFDKSVNINIIPAEKPAFIRGDSNLLEQALLNFCVNSEHSMTIMRNKDDHWGGDLTVSVKEITPDSYMLKNHPSMENIKYFILSVKDTGVGMNSVTISNIFNPFFTTKKKGEGSGLGLSMVYNIIKQHDGFIDVYSEPGFGSKFNIYLPALTDDKITGINHDIKQERLRGEGLILIIDDEKAIRKTASDILKTCGYSVMEAKNGLEGVNIYKENKNSIKAVILDMIMPEMSGKEAYLLLKEINPDIKVILTSGFQYDNRVQEVIQLGISAFLQKPYTIYTLSKTVHNILYDS